LYVTLPEAFLQVFSQATLTLELAVNVSLIGLLFCVLSIPLVLVFLPAYWAPCTVLVGFLIFFLAYRAAVHAARAYGALIRTAFDVYRFNLLKDMQLRLPTKYSEELRQWKQLSKIWYRGAPDVDQQEDLRYPN
jgi:hypothetical protein